MSDENASYVYFDCYINPVTVAKLTRLVYGLAAARPDAPICLLIHSEGGNIIHAIHAYEMLRALPVELTTFNVGWVASAAALLYVAGEKRIASPMSFFVFHHVVAGTSATHDSTGVGTNAVEPTRYRQADIIHERTGFSEDTAIGDKLVWRDHAWGVKSGFAHCVRHFSLPRGSNLLVASKEYFGGG